MEANSSLQVDFNPEGEFDRYDKILSWFEGKNIQRGNP